MIPNFLKKFESDLKKYEREFVRIKVKPRKEKLLEERVPKRWKWKAYGNGGSTQF
jgi:hypothetical protein